MGAKFAKRLPPSDELEEYAEDVKAVSGNDEKVVKAVNLIKQASRVYYEDPTNMANLDEFRKVLHDDDNAAVKYYEQMQAKVKNAGQDENLPGMKQLPMYYIMKTPHLRIAFYKFLQRANGFKVTPDEYALFFDDCIKLLGEYGVEGPKDDASKRKMMTHMLKTHFLEDRINAYDDKAKLIELAGADRSWKDLTESMKVWRKVYQDMVQVAFDTYGMAHGNEKKRFYSSPEYAAALTDKDYQAAEGVDGYTNPRGKANARVGYGERFGSDDYDARSYGAHDYVGYEYSVLDQGHAPFGNPLQVRGYEVSDWSTGNALSMEIMVLLSVFAMIVCAVCAVLMGVGGFLCGRFGHLAVGAREGVDGDEDKDSDDYV